MADPDTTAENPTFETDEVSATRGREQGLGVGARELAAQRDPGGVVTPDEDEAEGMDPDALDQSLGVLGTDDDETVSPQP